MSEKRIRDAAAVLDSLQSGWRPGERELEDAPLLDEYLLLRVATGSGAIFAFGVVTGHPEIPDGRAVRTSAVVAVDLEAGWMRTVSRFYRLGSPWEGR